jgi:hypothetical protein
MTKPRPLKKASITMGMAPGREILPQSVAASVGKTINRFAKLEYLQLGILVKLLGISIKQGRIVLRINRPGQFIQAVKLLLKFHGIEVTTQWSALNAVLEKADSTRNALAHSVFLQDPVTKELKIQLTSNIWDLGPQFEPVHRQLQPQGKAVNRAWLIEQRSYVEAALKMIDSLGREIFSELTTLNGRRQSERELDRRKVGNR